jgi:hypothetical protein
MISATRIIPHRSIQFISKSNETASTVIDKIHKVTDWAPLGGGFLICTAGPLTWVKVLGNLLLPLVLW